jgi:hypothetical protein
MVPGRQTDIIQFLYPCGLDSRKVILGANHGDVISEEFAEEYLDARFRFGGQSQVIRWTDLIIKL